MEIYNPPLKMAYYNRYMRMNMDEIPARDELTKKIYFKNGLSVNCKSTRMKMFLFYHKTQCLCCGIKTAFAAVETSKSANDFHMNFYGLTETGEEVLMTWDHIKPRSLGGKSGQYNAQCLCTVCNCLKGNNHTISEVREMLRNKDKNLWYNRSKPAKIRKSATKRSKIFISENIVKVIFTPCKGEYKENVEIEGYLDRDTMKFYKHFPRKNEHNVYWTVDEVQDDYNIID